MVEDVERDGGRERPVREGKRGSVRRREANARIEAGSLRQGGGDLLVSGVRVDALDRETAACQFARHDAHSRSKIEDGAVERARPVEDEGGGKLPVVSEGDESLPALPGGLLPS